MSDKENLIAEEINVAAYMDHHGTLSHDAPRVAHFALMPVAQHQRITEALRGELEGEREAARDANADYLELQSERDQLREELDSIKRMAECGTVQNWLKLPDEDKAKWFALMSGIDSDNKQLRAEVERLKQRLEAGWSREDRDGAAIVELTAQLAQQQGVPDGWRDLLRRAREFVDMWDDDSQEFMDLCGDIDNALAAAPAPARCEFHGADPDACQTYSGEVPCAPVQQPYKCATCCDSGIVGHSMLCTECNGAPVQAEPARGVV